MARAYSQDRICNRAKTICVGHSKPQGRVPLTVQSQLPSSGSERNIFLVALQEFSNNCEPPGLTPQCPFYEVVQSGPSCGEQCRDLLAEHGPVATPHLTVIALGDGIDLHPRRKKARRRGPDKATRPFDALEVKLRDADKPTSASHSTSLFLAFEDHASMPPDLSDDRENRNYIIRATFEELRRREYSPEMIIVGMASRVASSICIYMALPILMSGQTSLESYDLRSDWAKVRDEWTVDEKESERVRMFEALVTGKFYEAMRRWVSKWEIEDLVNWTAPVSVGELKNSGSPLSNELVTRSLWLVQRLTQTYCSDWATSSLHLEWLYIHGSETGCCTPSEMRLRKVDASEIAEVLAERSTEKWGSERRVDDSIYRAKDFVRVAAENLAAGKQDAAIAMYEALHQLGPRDPVVTNNLAFCHIPSDPQRALNLLDEAWSTKGSRSTVTIANRTLVLHLLGRDAEALSVAARIGDCDVHDKTAWLWCHHDDGTFELLSNQNVVQYVASLVHHISINPNCGVEH